MLKLSEESGSLSLPESFCSVAELFTGKTVFPFSFGQEVWVTGLRAEQSESH
ncbi:MAG: hypothetical protein ACRDE2_00585 [Chitinophagaceae bacterium]